MATLLMGPENIGCHRITGPPRSVVWQGVPWQAAWTGAMRHFNTAWRGAQPWHRDRVQKQTLKAHGGSQVLESVDIRLGAQAIE